jgi:hypothetical protein
VGKHLLVVQRLASDAATAEVVSAIQAAGVRVVLFKGPVIERWLYTDGTRREYGDIDLLVAPDRFPRAEQVLGELGFDMMTAPWRRFEFHDHEHAWARRGIKIDLHRAVWGFKAEPTTVWAALTSEVERFEVGGAAVDTPVASTQALMIAVHAVQHAGRGQPREDLRRALNMVDDSTWRDAARLASLTGALGSFTLGLGLLDPGQQVLERLSLDRAADAAAHLRARGPTPGSLTFLRLAEQPSLPHRVWLVVTKLAPSPDFLRFKYSIARRGRLGLLAAYAWRPVWLCLYAPAAWRAWRSAQAAARRS